MALPFRRRTRVHFSFSLYRFTSHFFSRRRLLPQARGFGFDSRRLWFLLGARRWRSYKSFSPSFSIIAAVILFCLIFGMLQRPVSKILHGLSLNRMSESAAHKAGGQKEIGRIQSGQSLNSGRLVSGP